MKTNVTIGARMVSEIQKNSSQPPTPFGPPVVTGRGNVLLEASRSESVAARGGAEGAGSGTLAVSVRLVASNSTIGFHTDSACTQYSVSAVMMPDAHMLRIWSSAYGPRFWPWQ